jgi:hypothetical protein
MKVAIEQAPVVVPDPGSRPPGRRRKLAPDFKTIAGFGRDNGAAIPATGRQFVMLRREGGLIQGSSRGVANE